MSKLQKSLTDYNATLVKEGETLLGDLGATIGGRQYVSVPGRASYVYVRLRTKLSELIQAFNDKVAQKYGVPVIVKRQGNRYVVVERNTETFSDWENNDPYIPQHASQHIFDKDGGNMGGDPVWVYPYQFMPSLVSPFGSRKATNVFIQSYPLVDTNGDWKYCGNTGTEKLTKYNPTSGSCFVLIALDSVSGNPVCFATTGTYIPLGITGTSQIIPYLPSVPSYNYLPEAAILLVSGTTGIGWSQIYDVRQFLSPHPTGSSYLSVGGNHGIDDLEFTGATVFVTGTTAFINITGSSGGVSDHEALTGLLGGSANDHWHLTPSQVIGLVSGTSTALHSHTGGIGTGTAGQVVKWGALGNTLVDAALIPPATNILTLTATAASTLGLAITAGKTLTLTATDNFNLTIPATGTAALLGTANVFTVAGQMIDSTNDVIDLRIQAHSTKTTSFLTFEKSTGTVVAGVDLLGRLFSYGFAAVTTNTFMTGAGNGTLTGNYNIGIGNNVMPLLESGAYNVGLGVNTFALLTTGGKNFALGGNSFIKLISGSDNVGIGYNTGNTITGSQNIAIGSNAMQLATSGGGNVAIGYNAGFSPLDGIANTLIGWGAGKGTGSAFNYNVCIGYEAGLSLTTGSGNVFLGWGAGDLSTSGNNKICIGFQAGYRQTTLSNILIIDNVARASAAVEITNAIIYGVMGATPDVQTFRLNAVTTIAVPTTTNNAPLVLFDLNAYVSTAATGFTTGGGVAFTMTGETATDGTSQIMAQIAALWTDATNATRKAKLQLSAYDTAQRIGIEIEASGTVAQLGFFGATTVVQQLAATDLGVALSNLGLRVAGTAYPITTTGAVTVNDVNFNSSTPSALAGDVNNWDLGNYTFIRASGGAADRIITGIVACADGHLLKIHNIGTTNKLSFANESASSTAANRLINSNAGTTEILPNHAIQYIYDATTARWREETHL